MPVAFGCIAPSLAQAAGMDGEVQDDLGAETSYLSQELRLPSGS